MELRSLRKNAIELEEHSALLQNHVDNMESVVADLEQDVELTKVTNLLVILALINRFQWDSNILKYRVGSALANQR